MRTTLLPLDRRVTISTRGKPSILSTLTLRYRLSSLMWIRMLQKFLGSLRWHVVPSWNVPLIMAAPPTRRAWSILLFRPLRSLPVIRFPMPVLKIPRHLVTKLGSASTPLSDTAPLYLISQISKEMTFLPTHLTAVVNKPIYTLSSIPTSGFSASDSPLLP